MYKLLTWVLLLHVSLKYIIGYFTEVTTFHFILSRLFLVLFIIYVWFYKNRNSFNYSTLKSKFWIAVSLLIISSGFLFAIRDIPGNQLHDHYLLLGKCIMVGVFEELLFRYIVFFYFIEKTDKYKYSILWTSLIFALFHGTNLLMGMDIYSTISQIEIAFLLGLFLQFIFLKTSSLIIVISIHALFNFLGSYNNLETHYVNNYETIKDFFSSQVIILIIYLIFMPIYLWGLRINNYK